MNKKLLILLIIILFFFILGIAYVSILGENHKINQAFETFFDSLKKSNYNAAYSVLFLDNKEINNIKNQRKFLFCLETTLLKASNLLNESNYSIKIKREAFWIPFVGNNSIPISVVLFDQNNKGFFSFGGVNYLKEVFTATREDGIWKIKTIDIEKSYLSSSYNDIYEKLEYYDRLSVDKNIFKFDKIELDLGEMSFIEKRILKFIFWNAGKVVEEVTIAPGK